MSCRTLHRASFLPGVLVALLLGACGEPAATPTSSGWEFVPTGGDGQAVVQPREFLLNAGCTARPTGRDSSAVVVPLPQGGMTRFSCKGVGRNALRRAIAKYQAAVRSAGQWAALTSGLPEAGEAGYLAYVGQKCNYSGGRDVKEYWWEGNVMYWVVEWVPGKCNWVDQYEWVPPTTTDPGAPDGGGPGTALPGQPCLSTDPACWRAPTEAEKALLRQAWRNQFADSSLITDPLTRQECSALRGWLDAAMATLDSPTPRIGIGTSDNEPDGLDHTGETDASGTRFHVDPELIAKAGSSFAWEKELLAQLLHEAAHLAPQRKLHPNADRYLADHPHPTVSASVIYGNDPWFRTVHSEAGGKLCIQN